MDLAVKLLIVGLVVVALWRLLQPRYAFVIRIAGGQARVRRGKVTPIFLQQILEACEQAGVASGWVSGTQRGKRMVLVFSRNIPAGCQQRIRNAWVAGG
jgi:Protein of unknown function (DUF3634)